jgi:hypothetical protein
MCVMSGIAPDAVGGMTFREIEWVIRSNRLKHEREWEQTRLIVAALTGKKPKQLIRLPLIDGEVEKIEWTPELANEVLKHFGEKE